MGKTILMIHGRSFKPAHKDLSRLWLESIRHGIERDYPGKAVAFEKAHKEMIYYGDLSNEYLRSIGREYSAGPDTRDREKTLEALKAYAANQFTKSHYKKIPGQESVRELLADIFAGPLDWFGLSGPLIRKVAPDVGEYWNHDSLFGSDCRSRMSGPLREAMERGDKIMVISHSLGTLIAYDTFWKFSRMAEYRELWKNRIDFWITLGSPLGNETVKDHLRGSRASNERRYPSNIKRWENFAAEDDYISHDQGLKNDYKRMLRLGLVKRLRDHRVYNLAVRKGKSNPHNSSGYLVHPKVIQMVKEWL
jgi:hypothetical protein